MTEAVRTLFEERNAPVLLVLDSLDEAPAADERVGQADTLPPTWRIVLTSRPGSWNRQLRIDESQSSTYRKVGSLQPLRYPDDVDPFIDRWFAGRPLAAAGLKAELRNRAAIQEAATVPLILAFYCIVAGGAPLPARRTDLSARVIRRMLTGRWRGGAHRDPDPGACMQTLRNWAWSAASRSPVSGTGEWDDEFLAPRVATPGDRDALDHVAVPAGPADPDTGMTLRRFVHRSVREHLVAEHVALLPAEAAAGELLNHLWYDPDWEHAAPAALALHPQRDEVLRDLIGNVTGGSGSFADLTAVDGCWEIRWFLTRVALETEETDWSPDARSLISQARMNAALLSPRTDGSRVGAYGWPESDQEILKALFTRLDTETDPWTASRLAATLTYLNPSAEDLQRARRALLGLLADERNRGWEERLAYSIARLQPTAGERADVRLALLRRLPELRDEDEELPGAIAAITVTEQERAQVKASLTGLLADRPGTFPTRALAKGIMWMNPTAAELGRVRALLLDQLSQGVSVHQGLWLGKAIGRMKAPADERAQARAALFKLLSSKWGYTKPEITQAITELAVTEQERNPPGTDSLRISPISRTFPGPAWPNGCWGQPPTSPPPATTRRK
jgi:hypothetical protein